MIPEAADFDAIAMRLAVNEFEAEKAGKEMYITYLDPGKIYMDLKLWPFKDAFLNMAKNIMGLITNPYMM